MAINFSLWEMPKTQKANRLKKQYSVLPFGLIGIVMTKLMQKTRNAQALIVEKKAILFEKILTQPIRGISTAF